MKQLVELAKSDFSTEWNPKGDFGKALKAHEALMTSIVDRGHSDTAIYRAWGFEGSADFGRFRAAMRGLRDFNKR